MSSDHPGIRVIPNPLDDGRIVYRIEIDDSFLDEIVISDPKGRGWFHLERMDDNHIWFVIYPGRPKNGEHHVNLHWNQELDSSTMEITEIS